ncbi:MAG: response regulator, partial [Candidatus Latescibacteria bacterium]|nr:response regulator [Candidatus Latescibacterota bacterium]
MTAPRPRRILVAEDSRTMAAFMCRVLENAGFEIVLAHDGEECLDKARTTGPDLVILDLMMPKIHGLDVLKQLKADPPEPVPGVMVCSAKDFKTEVEQARELGAFSFLSKPFSHQELLAQVEGFFSARNPSVAHPHSLHHATEGVFRPQLRSAHGMFRLWGTRGSIPVSGPGFVRHGGNTSSMEVGHQEDRILFDAGSGIRDLGLSLLAGPPCHLHLFITHTHWDHIQGFPFFAPAFTPGFEITLYAPPNTDKDLESIFRGQLDRAYFPVQMEDMRAHLE